MKNDILEIIIQHKAGHISTKQAANELLDLFSVSLSLLGVAKCPNSNCDNNGTIAYQTANGDWEPEPCEWCHRKNELLNNEG